MAADRPAGPPPTITTSYSITSRSTPSSGLERRQIVDDGFLTGVFRAAFDGVFGHGFP